jgi:hypothetical protein
MPNPWVSLRHDQLILVNKAVNEKEQLDKRAGGGGGKKRTQQFVCDSECKEFFFLLSFKDQCYDFVKNCKVWQF